MSENKVRSCKEIRVDYDEEYRRVSDKFSADILAAALRDFPVGKTVRYQHGLNWITATVVKHGEHGWNGDKVVIENVKTKNRRDVYVYELEDTHT